MEKTSVVGLFCEDIRREISHQVTLIGIYPDKIEVPGFPGVIPRIGLYNRIQFDPRNAPTQIEIKVTYPGEEESLLTAFEEKMIAETSSEAIASETPLASLISTTVVSPFAIKQAGLVVSTITIDGESYISAALRFLKIAKAA